MSRSRPPKCPHGRARCGVCSGLKTGRPTLPTTEAIDEVRDEQCRECEREHCYELEFCEHSPWVDSGPIELDPHPGYSDGDIAQTLEEALR